MAVPEPELPGKAQPEGPAPNQAKGEAPSTPVPDPGRCPVVRPLAVPPGSPIFSFTDREDHEKIRGLNLGIGVNKDRITRFQ